MMEATAVMATPPTWPQVTTWILEVELSKLVIGPMTLLEVEARHLAIGPTPLMAVDGKLLRDAKSPVRLQSWWYIRQPNVPSTGGLWISFLARMPS